MKIYINREDAIEALCVMECGDDSEDCIKETCEIFTTLMSLPIQEMREDDHDD